MIEKHTQWKQSIIKNFQGAFFVLEKHIFLKQETKTGFEKLICFV
jgi:hypothetical protein